VAGTFLASVYLLLAPHPAGAGLAPDWVGHAVLFAALGSSTGLWAATAGSRPRRVVMVAGLLAVIVYGPVTEVAQGFTGRDPQLSDALVDVAAGILSFAGGWVLWGVLARVMRVAP
jgi:VanZ family protein